MDSGTQPPPRWADKVVGPIYNNHDTTKVGLKQKSPRGKLS